MKKLLFIIVMLLVMSASAVCYAYGTETSGEWEYFDEGLGTVIITGYNGNSKKVYVPSTLGGKPVTAVSSGAFTDNDTMETVNITNGIKVIDFGAFMNCTALKTVYIGADVEKIGNTNDYLTWNQYKAASELSGSARLPAPYVPAFMDCDNLEEFIVNLNNPTFSSKDGVLFNKDKSMLLLCPTGKTGSYTVPDSVTALDPRGTDGYHVSPFCDCKKLEELILSDNIVGDIGWFGEMSSLKHLYIGKGILEDDGYNNSIVSEIIDTTSLEQIDVSPEHETLTSVDGVLFNKDMSILHAYPAKKVGDYTVPNSVNEIAGNAFANSEGLNSVILPNSLATINYYAFKGSSLKGISIPKSVNKIGYGAFSYSDLENISWPATIPEIQFQMFDNCKNLTTASIEDGVTKISHQAFSGCENLQTINIPNSVNVIESQVFWGCSNLRAINLPKNISKIETGAFSNSGLEAFDWPENITTIENDMFKDCKNLKTVNITESVTGIGNYAFAGTAIEDFTLPSQITNVSYGLFDNCTNLKEINIPDEVTSIDGYAFRNTAIEKISLPDTVQTIGYNAFENCVGLTYIHFPESLKHIYNNAFCGCTNLDEIELPQHIESIRADAFKDCNSLFAVSYSGSNTQWKDVYIETGNQALTYANISFGCNYLYEITDLRLLSPSGESISKPTLGQSFTAEVKAIKNEQSDLTCTVMLAIYAKNGRLLRLEKTIAKYMPITEYTYIFNIPPQSAEVASVKAFIWDNCSSAEPMAECMELNCN